MDTHILQHIAEKHIDLYAYLCMVQKCIKTYKGLLLAQAELLYFKKIPNPIFIAIKAGTNNRDVKNKECNSCGIFTSLKCDKETYIHLNEEDKPYILKESKEDDKEITKYLQKRLLIDSALNIYLYLGIEEFLSVNLLSFIKTNKLVSWYLKEYSLFHLAIANNLDTLISRTGSKIPISISVRLPDTETKNASMSIPKEQNSYHSYNDPTCITAITNGTISRNSVIVSSKKQSDTLHKHIDTVKNQYKGLEETLFDISCINGNRYIDILIENDFSITEIILFQTILSYHRGTVSCIIQDAIDKNLCVYDIGRYSSTFKKDW